MTAHAAEFFSMNGANQLRSLQDVIDRRLGISDRQCRYPLPRYRESYPFGIANCCRGKPMAIQMMALSGGAEIHSVYSERHRHVICFKDFAVMH